MAHEDISAVILTQHKNIILFAYGSGFAASMFRLYTTEPLTKDPSLLHQLSRRVKLTPTDYSLRMQKREEDYQRANFSPQDNLAELRVGTVYLEKVDEKWRRYYKRLTPKL